MNTFNITNKVFGKNLSIGNYYKYYCKKRIKLLLQKYTSRVISYHASLERKKHFYKVKLKVTFAKSVELKATGRDKMPYKAFNAALLNLSKMMRRYIRKTKFRNKNRVQLLNLKESFLDFNNL